MSLCATEQHRLSSTRSAYLIDTGPWIPCARMWSCIVKHGTAQDDQEPQAGHKEPNLSKAACRPEAADEDPSLRQTLTDEREVRRADAGT